MPIVVGVVENLPHILVTDYRSLPGHRNQGLFPFHLLH